MAAGEFRIEHDTMGEVRVPADALWAAQTQRAVENFPISGAGLEDAQIIALARIKRAAAIVNTELGRLDAAIADAIVASADEIIAGGHLDQFPIDVYQTGSGTSSNMNINEVLASLATSKLGAPVHPNDHVNASQSSNDVFPTSVHVAATEAMIRTLIPALEHLAASLDAKATLWAETVKSGRTHLMDATPVTFGQEFGGYARMVRLGIERVENAIPHLAEVPLGGTATGTGINTPAGFSPKVIAILAGVDRPADHRGARPLRGAGRARRSRRGVRSAAHDRREPHQDLQRHPVDGVGPEHGPRRARTSPTCSRARRSCQAR